MMTKEEFLLLYNKYLAGECTPEEIQQLEAYKDDITMPDDQWSRQQFGEKKRLLSDLKKRFELSIPEKDQLKQSDNFVWLKVASVAIILLSVSILLLRSPQQVVKKQEIANNPIETKILPGGNKAYLTMANGSVITLSDVKNGSLGKQMGVQVNKVKDGVLQYSEGSHQSGASEGLSFNIINTPRGGQYQVLLADGTKVWLNSASSLKYPTQFNGIDRKVELTGEAYFEVAKNPSKPFKVNVNGVTVQVLGTHFNIMGYNDEKEVKTTLLEGSVKLIHAQTQALLKPGQQGVLNSRQTGFSVKDVDVDDEVAWKNGFFAFNNEDIQTIMKRIARWYDVDIIFPEKLIRKNFGGTVSRFNDVSQVLKSLELTGSVHFKVQGRRIIVMP